MELNSRFRTLFLLRKVSAFIFSLLCCTFLINRGINRNERELIVISIVVQIISVFMLKYRIGKIYKLKVVKNGILKIPLLNNENEIILFTDIKDVRLEKVDGMSSETGEITMGYFESILILNTNKKILISPDHFENYNEIIKTIKLNRNKEEN